MLSYMRSTSSDNFWITSISQTTILNRLLTSAYLATVLDLVQIPHAYQQLYHAFSQKPSHHQEGMDNKNNNLEN